MRKQKALGIVCAVLTFAGAVVGTAISAQEARQSHGQETVVKIVAQRFVYTPNEIVLQKGQPAILEFSSLDFMHGFSIPDLKIRADLPPGQVTRVALTPEKSGVYDFLCDNFCGAGHEQMNGRIIVKD